jgi:hypothetical protein
MSNNTYLWQFTCFTLRHAFSKFDEFEERMPTTAFGEKAFIWGEEEQHGSFAICEINGINFMDWIDKPKGDHHDFYGNDKLAEIFISTAKSEVKNPDEYQKEMLATLVKKGYVIKNDDEFKVTVPVFIKAEYQQIENILNPVINEVNKKSREIHNITERILRNYTPPHLKKSIDVIACMHLFEDAISAPVHIMHRKDYLKTDWDANEMPTTYIILNK